MREFFTMAVSSFPYPFVIFLSAAAVGVALVILRDHLRRVKEMPKQSTHPAVPLDELYNE